MPQIVDYAQSSIAIRYAINQYPEGEKVMYIVKVFTQSGILFHFLVYAVDMLGSA
ncbi:hypothetical protein ES703_78024 [subsurface metagenome]